MILEFSEWGQEDLVGVVTARAVNTGSVVPDLKDKGGGTGWGRPFLQERPPGLLASSMAPIQSSHPTAAMWSL